MTYKVTLDVYQGANRHPEYQTDYQVEETGLVSALSKAEQHLNVLLPEDQYCVARYAAIVFDPRPAAGHALVHAG